MRTCLKCNLSFDDDKKFCKKCGAPLTSVYQIEPKEIAKKTVYEDRLKIDPLNIELLHEYAQFLFNNLLFKEAITVSLKILAINDNDLESNELLFKSYSKLNMINEASTFGKQLLLEKPTDIFLLEELTKISRELGNSDKAIEYSDKIISLNPSNASAIYNKALILLEDNQLEPAIKIFRKIYQEGQNDRITTIYAGIDKALNADFKAAIDLFVPTLNDEKLDQNDINTYRGVLYLVYSLCQSSMDLPEIKKWVAKVNLKNLKQNYHQFDEIAYVKIIEYIISLRLNMINSTPDAKSQIIEFTKSYIREDYFTAISNSKIAEIWYAIGNKQAEFKLFIEAVDSFQKASDLMPNEYKYKEKYVEIEKLINIHIRKINRRKSVGYVLFIVGVIIIASSIFAYRFFLEKKTFDLAKDENSPSSYQSYLNKYSEGKYLTEVNDLYEKAFWNSIIKHDIAMSYDCYISTFIGGKHIVEANSALKRLDGYNLNFSIGHAENFCNLYSLKINYNSTEAVIYSARDGSMHKPGSNKAFFIRDNVSNKIYKLNNASVNFEERIPANKMVHLYFDKIPFQTKNIDIIEGSCSSGCWNMYNINILRAVF